MTGRAVGGALVDDIINEGADGADEFVTGERRDAFTCTKSVNGRERRAHFIVVERDIDFAHFAQVLSRRVLGITAVLAEV